MSDQVEEQPFLVFDVGNTRIKAGVFRGGAVHEFQASAPAPPGVACLVESFRASGLARPIAIATVNTATSDELRRELVRHGVDARLVLPSDGRLFEAGLLHADLETPAATGVDRQLSAIAAGRRAPGKTVIVVDCGSAVTVNLTTADRVFLGGAILPGVRLAARALRQETFALPEVIIERPVSALGRSTAAAIRAGIFFGLAGAIDRLVEELSGIEPAAGTCFEVFVTGGDARLLGPALATRHQIVDALVLEGLGHAAGQMLR